MLRIVLCALCALTTVAAQYSDDDLFILIDEVSVFSCRGVKNEIKLTEDDVNIVNEKGNKVYYVRAPGNYSLHFKNIDVQKDFGFLAGEIGVTLQVPIIEGPAGMRFDIPYPMIPETGLLSQKCDANSGIVERNGRQYCRYCDLCGVADDVQGSINQEHKFLVNAPGDTRTDGHCGSVDAKKYDFKRTISLPGKSTLEKMVKDKMSGIDKEVTKRLNKGRGRFQVFLNLIAASKPSMSQKTWFDSSADCKCCTQKEPSAECGSLSFLYCNIEDCKSAWAQQCLHNTARIAACFTIEFNYRMTTSYAEVLQFLRENNYPNQNVDTPKPRVPPASIAHASSHPVIPPAIAEKIIAQRTHALPASRQQRPVETEKVEEAPVEQPEAREHSDGADADDEGTLSERCVKQMPQKLTHLRRYCTIFWNTKLCCTHCVEVCSSSGEK